MPLLLQMLIRKFKDNPAMKSDSKVVLDPDLIDLTMIPPPMTPDEVHDSKMLSDRKCKNIFARMVFPDYSPEQ